MHKPNDKTCTCIFCERLANIDARALNATQAAELQARYSDNMSRAIDRMPGIMDAARKAMQDAATTGTGAYILTDAGTQYVSPAELAPEPTQAQLDYMAAREALAADKLKPRKPTQQDEQLEYAYQNGYSSGRRSMANTVASIMTVIVLLAMLCTCIGLILWEAL